jgi:hypothetical protein
MNEKLVAFVRQADLENRRLFEKRMSDPNIETRGGGASCRPVRPRHDTKGPPEFLDVAFGNGVWISPDCLNKDSKKVDSKCKSNPLECGHAHVKVEQHWIGHYVSFECYIVHSSRYPKCACAIVAQFFFSLAVYDDRVHNTRSRCTGSDKSIRRPYVEGVFNHELTMSVGTRVVEEWSGAFASRTARAANVFTFEGKSLDDDTKVWPKDIIDSDLEARCNCMSGVVLYRVLEASCELEEP